MVFVLYAAGSPLIVDYEEAVLSCGADLAAIVKNIDGPSLASNQSKLILKEHLDEETLGTARFLIPLFTPGHRYSAASEVTAIAKKADVTMAFGTLVHATAIVANSAEVHPGTFINAGTTVGAKAVIREHCILNRAVSIGHHVELQPYVSIGPGATLAGQIRIGRGSVIGAGAVVLPGVDVGENAVVAAGSVVAASTVPSNAVVSGNPARQRGRRIEGYGKTSVPLPATGAETRGLSQA